LPASIGASQLFRRVREIRKVREIFLIVALASLHQDDFVFV
jgi:hypothetical protein